MKERNKKERKKERKKQRKKERKKFKRTLLHAFHYAKTIISYHGVYNDKFENNYIIFKTFQRIHFTYYYSLQANKLVKFYINCLKVCKKFSVINYKLANCNCIVLQV